MQTIVPNAADHRISPESGKIALLSRETDCDGPAAEKRSSRHEFVRISICDEEDPGPIGDEEDPLEADQQHGTVAKAIWRCEETGRERVYGVMRDYIGGREKYEEEYGPLAVARPRAGERMAYVPRRLAVPL